MKDRVRPGLQHRLLLGKDTSAKGVKNSVPWQHNCAGQEVLHKYGYIKKSALSLVLTTEFLTKFDVY